MSAEGSVQKGATGDLHARHFGHPKWVTQLAARIERHFSQSAARRPVEKALVIGIFGEWGSGKSTVLHQLAQRFAVETLPPDDKSLTLPVEFNPWRYEKEKHLIIPLLKTLQLSLAVATAESEPDDGAEQEQTQKKVPVWKERVKKIGTQLGDAAVAFFSAFEGGVEMEVPGLGKINLKAAPKDAIEVFRNARQAQEKPALDWLDEQESLYFDFSRRLEALTQGGEGKPPLNLLFLIDDLDRCLPEKALEMLEAVKLFFDVSRCVFVLALDEEVVERGVTHRYRDYIFQNHHAAPAEGASHARAASVRADLVPPITGPEYLEKIIHLPFRLPLPSRDEVRDFLRETYPELFPLPPKPEQEELEQEETGQEKTGDKAKEKAARLMDGQAEKQRQAAALGNDLLELFAAAIPPVPRKLQRAAELLELLLPLARERGLLVDEKTGLFTLARLVILQLFAPALYRYARRKAGALKMLEAWQKGYGDQWRSREWVPPSLVQEAGYASQQDTHEAHNQRAARILYSDLAAQPGSLQEQGALLQRQDERELFALVCEAQHNRSGFNLGALIRDDTPFADLKPYLELQAPPQPAATPWQEDLPAGTVDSEDGFLARMASGAPDQWATALGQDGLYGRSLPPALFERMLNAETTAERARAPEWLAAVAPHLTERQLLRLYGETGLLRHLLNNARSSVPSPLEGEGQGEG